MKDHPTKKQERAKGIDSKHGSKYSAENGPAFLEVLKEVAAKTDNTVDDRMVDDTAWLWHNTLGETVDF